MLLAAPHAVRPLAAALGVCLALAASGAAATTTKPADKNAAPPAAKPALVGTYGDWSVFQSQAGKNRICYTLAQPKERAPADLKRDPAYAFISERPGEGVRNEVSFIMGFDVAGAAPAAEAKDAKEKDKKKDKKKEPETVAPTAVIGDSDVRPSAQGRQSLGQERRQGERADRRKCARAPSCRSRPPPRRATSPSTPIRSPASARRSTAR